MKSNNIKFVHHYWSFNINEIRKFIYIRAISITCLSINVFINIRYGNNKIMVYFDIYQCITDIVNLKNSCPLCWQISLPGGMHMRPHQT
jgi:hypothetical protein